MADISPASSHTASSDHHAVSPSSVHDSSSMSQTLPLLEHDAPSTQYGRDEKHPRGKRKRTAAKDKSILEEAYKNNPKPDKQARLDIVDRVSLNEKEVQIWFQNRRQNDRRKSRPLSTQEIAALRYGGLHNITSDPDTSQSFLSESDATYPNSDPISSHCTEAQNNSPGMLQSLVSSQSLDKVQATPVLSRSNSHLESTPVLSQEQPASSQESHDGRVGSHSVSGSVGYLANRWNLGSSFSTPSTLGRDGEDSFRLEPFPSSAVSVESVQSASQSQSQMRLSLSLEGKAELVSNQTSPTRAPLSRALSTIPPLPRVRRQGLQRSHSASPGITLPPISALTNSLPPRIVRGRSRDVHAWELCADSDTRDELTTHAENESNGSAIAAISLIRSTSSVLQPSSASKRNATVAKHQQTRQAKKPKLGRTNSSVARLEHETSEIAKPHDKLDGKVKVSMLMSPTDSDKENWSPDEDGRPQDISRRRPLPAGSAKTPNPRRLGRVLQEQQKGPAFLSSRANTAPTRGRGVAKDMEIFEDTDDAKGNSSRQNDVERFMRGEVSPSKKPDMDCVAGLLSLSQGAWR